jgi:hypothetical protein
LVSAISELYISIEDYLYENAKKEFLDKFNRIQADLIKINISKNKEKSIPPHFYNEVYWCSKNIRSLSIRANIWFQTETNTFQKNQTKF